MDDLSVVHVVNKITDTSVPLQWVNFQNKNMGLRHELIDFKEFLNLSHTHEKCVYHTHHAKSSLIVAFLSRMSGCRHVHTVHGNLNQDSVLNRLMIIPTLLLAARIVFVNPCLYSQLPRFYKKIIRGRWVVIANGIDSKFLTGIKVHHSSKVEDVSFKIVHLARFVKEKNHKNLLCALTYLPDKFQLFLVGDGPLRHFFEGFAQSVGVGHRVTFLGVRAHLEALDILKNSNCSVMPSHSEGLNVTALESIALSIPLVISRIPSFNHMFSDVLSKIQKQSVFFCDPDDPVSIANAISCAVTTEVDNGGCENISIQTMLARYDDVYREALNIDG